MTERDGFLTRWSRRKRGDAPLEDAAEAAGAPAEETAPPAEEAAPPAELPDIDSLGKDSDYTGFLRAGVPEGLRRAALRKLWRSDPVLANLDGLNDYDEDFAHAFTEAVTKTVKTAYRVGKGWLEDGEAAAERPEEDREADGSDEPKTPPTA